MTQFDRLNRDVLNTLKPYLGKEIDRAIIEGMTSSRRYSYLTWFSRTVSIVMGIGVIDILMMCMREKELVGAWVALLLGAPCTITVALIAEYAQSEQEKIDIANQSQQLRLTVELLEKAKKLQT